MRMHEQLPLPARDDQWLCPHHEAVHKVIQDWRGHETPMPWIGTREQSRYKSALHFPHHLCLVEECAMSHHLTIR